MKFRSATVGFDYMRLAAEEHRKILAFLKSAN